MKLIFLAILFIVFDLTVEADEVKTLKIERRSIPEEATTYVVNNEFCFSCQSEEEKDNKKALEKISAVLKNDPRADLPSSFTICSSVMTTYGRRQP